MVLARHGHYPDPIQRETPCHTHNCPGRLSFIAFSNQVVPCCSLPDAQNAEEHSDDGLARTTGTQALLCILVIREAALAAKIHLPRRSELRQGVSDIQITAALRVTNKIYVCTLMGTCRDAF